MNLLALDISSTRIRAVRGLSPREARVVALERDHTDLPMAINLEGRHAKIGTIGLQISRRSPHLVCTDFLPHLVSTKIWKAGRHKLTASQAMAMAFEKVCAQAGRPQGCILAVPAYLEEDQLQELYLLAKKTKINLLGSLDRPLAAALAAQREQPWSGAGLVIDVDDHALTVARATVQSGEAQIQSCYHSRDLSERAWKERLLTIISDRCVRQSRRDPRQNAQAEQHLYEQLEEVLTATQEGRHLEIAIRSENWFQNVFLAPEQSAAACSRLIQKTMKEIHALWEQSSQEHEPAAMVLTHSAARLPGLLPAVESFVRQWNDRFESAEEEETDFGEQLLGETATEHVRIHALSPDAMAQAVHELGLFFHRGAIDPGHLEISPILDARPVDRGPARLEFRGEEYHLTEDLYTLGRAKECDIVLESEVYPSVSGLHCEILFDRGNYILRDCSRNGTLVNDRMVDQPVALQPGDWVRLGQGGPLLRFLGQRQQRKMMTRA